MRLAGAAGLIPLFSPFMKRASFQLAAELFPSLILAHRLSRESLRFGDILHIPQRLRLVAGPAHQLIGLGETEEIRNRMFRDQIFGFMTALDTALPALRFEQRFALPRREIEAAHQTRPAK